MDNSNLNYDDEIIDDCTREEYDAYIKFLKCTHPNPVPFGASQVHWQGSVGTLYTNCADCNWLLSWTISE